MSPKRGVRGFQETSEGLSDVQIGHKDPSEGPREVQIEPLEPSETIACHIKRSWRDDLQWHKHGHVSDRDHKITMCGRTSAEEARRNARSD